MHLPDILKSWRGMKRLHRFGVAAFARTIIHDGDARM